MLRYHGPGATMIACKCGWSLPTIDIEQVNNNCQRENFWVDENISCWQHNCCLLPESWSGHQSYWSRQRWGISGWPAPACWGGPAAICCCKVCDFCHELGHTSSASQSFQPPLPIAVGLTIGGPAAIIPGELAFSSEGPAMAPARPASWACVATASCCYLSPSPVQMY